MLHDPKLSRHLQIITVGIFVFMSLVSLALIANDVSDIRNPVLLAIVITVRILFSGFILSSCLVYLRSGSSLLFSHLVMIIITLATILSAGITWTRPEDSGISYYITILVIISAWALPVKHVLSQAIPLFFLLVSDIISLLLHRTLDERTTGTIIVTLVSSNLLGAWVAWRLSDLRKLEQQTLDTHRREARLRQSMTDALFDGIIVSRNQAIVDCNQTLSTLMDRSAEDLQGEQIQAILTNGADSHSDGHPFSEGGPFLMSLHTAMGEVPVEIRNRTIEIDDQPHLLTIVHDRSTHLAMEEQMEWIGSHEELGKNLAARIDALSLSKREKEVVGLVLAGKSRTQIADTLCISDETVKQHLTNIYRKLEIRGKADLFSIVYEH